jgi:hypothetical protein
MAAGKEIRGKIKSVENTKKITKAMEMVAASKMRKAQERMRSARPYTDKIRTVSAHLAQANPEYTHPFLVKHEKSKKIGIIVITTDKGLCGALNTNLLREVAKFDPAKTIFVACGRKGSQYLARTNRTIAAEFELRHRARHRFGHELLEALQQIQPPTDPQKPRQLRRHSPHFQPLDRAFRHPRLHRKLSLRQILPQPHLRQPAAEFTQNGLICGFFPYFHHPSNITMGSSVSNIFVSYDD